MDAQLRTDGPHSPDYTREVGDVFAASVRVLNYATMGNAPGLEYPGDVYSLLGALYTGTQRLPQLLDQVDAFLAALGSSGRLAADDGLPVAGLIAGAGANLHYAAGFARDLTARLHAVQNAIAGLSVKDGAE